MQSHQFLAVLRTGKDKIWPRNCSLGHTPSLSLASCGEKRTLKEGANAPCDREAVMPANRRLLQIGIVLYAERHHWFSCAFLAYLITGLFVVQSAAAQSIAGWTWVGGSNMIDQPGIYGTLGRFAPGNIPPGRWHAVSWTDKSGNLWLFGGSGYDSATNAIGVLLNDLWEFNPTLKEWAWMGGGSAVGVEAQGVYGSMETPAEGNVPGSRTGAVGWTDADGNLWLFGGKGLDGTGNVGALNDLWEYIPSTHEWTWMGGSNSVGKNGGRPGVYGAFGVPAPGNVPGSRSEAVSWVDQTGDLWLFGGGGFDAKGISGILNDLWEFERPLNEWAWMGGRNTLPKDGGLPGVYGTLGKRTVGNMPGGRLGATGLIDRAGNLWLFGGSGYDADGVFTTLNDLWEWNPATRAWSWMGGSAASTGCSTHQEGPVIICGGHPGVYGVLGVSAAGNIPGARAGAASWTDKAGNLWLLGGQGYDSAHNDGILNDFWKFSPSFNRWTWMGGSSVAGDCNFAPAGVIVCEGQPGVYGILGTPALENAPGGRLGAAAWKDNAGNFWLFGGYGNGRAGKDAGALNDLWEYRVGATIPSK